MRGSEGDRRTRALPTRSAKVPAAPNLPTRGANGGRRPSVGSARPGSRGGSAPWTQLESTQPDHVTPMDSGCALNRARSCHRGLWSPGGFGCTISASQVQDGDPCLPVHTMRWMRRRWREIWAHPNGSTQTASAARILIGVTPGSRVDRSLPATVPSHDSARP